LGWTYPAFKHLHFGLSIEGGKSSVTGHPISLDNYTEFTFLESIDFWNLAGRLEISWVPLKWLAVTPSVAFGGDFLTIVYKKDVYDMYLDNPAVTSTGTDLMANARIALGIEPVSGLVFYAAAGVDVIIEEAGVIPLPEIEVGVRLYPARLINLFSKRQPRQIPIATVTTTTPPLPPPPPEPVYRETRQYSLVYFDSDNTELYKSQYATLDAAAELLKSDANARLIIAGYSAPFKEVEGRERVSEKRAEVCRDYLIDTYQIDQERIAIEWYGSRAEPVSAALERQKFGWYEVSRSAELILITYEEVLEINNIEGENYDN
jgi:outer membrane protein OmpA-like peptidoglycan-associated protein